MTRKFTPPTSFPAEYRDGKGRKVVLHARGEGACPLIGQMSWETGGFDAVCFDEAGTRHGFASDSPTTLRDLPKETARFINFYGLDCDSGAFGTDHSTKHHADTAFVSRNRIGVIEIRQVEGEDPTFTYHKDDGQ